MTTTVKHISKISKKLTRKKTSDIQFTAHIEQDDETGLYIGIVPNLPGAHTQSETLDELHKNLKEVIELCLIEGYKATRKECKSLIEDRDSIN